MALVSENVQECKSYRKPKTKLYCNGINRYLKKYELPSRAPSAMPFRRYTKRYSAHRNVSRQCHPASLVVHSCKRTVFIARLYARWLAYSDASRYFLSSQLHSAQIASRLHTGRASQNGQPGCYKNIFWRNAHDIWRSIWIQHIDFALTQTDILHDYQNRIPLMQLLTLCLRENFEKKSLKNFAYSFKYYVYYYFHIIYK